MEFIISNSLGGDKGQFAKVCRSFMDRLPFWAQCPEKKVVLMSVGEWSNLHGQNVLKITVNPIKKPEALAYIFGKIISDAIESNQKIKERAKLHIDILTSDPQDRSSNTEILYQHLGLYIWEGDKMKKVLRERYDFCYNFFKDMEQFEGAQ